MNNINQRTQKIVTLGMLCAFSFVVLLVTRIPIEFLTYDAKDAVIAIGGFLFGPLSAALISIVVSLLEMISISSTGIIGLIMNILSTGAFACTAAFIYKKKHTLGGAILGLMAGVFLSTGIMLIWNYLLTPLYMGAPRETVIALMVPFLLPFNLIKGGLNAAVTLLLYKPMAMALQKAGLLPRTHSHSKHRTLGVSLVALVLMATFILLILVMKGML